MPLINFSGLASGIDSEALIDATSEASRAVRVVPLEEEITRREEENSALDELKAMLDELKSLGEEFTSLNGGVVSKTVSSSDETAVSAVASNAAEIANYEIASITSLASNATFSFSEAITDPFGVILDTGGGAQGDGAIAITVGSASGGNQETFTFDVTADDTTFSELVAEINNATTRVTASLVNVGTESSPSYKMVITSNDIGTADAELSIDTNVAHSVSAEQYLDDDALDDATATLDQATDAVFEITGIGTVTKSSNTISDLFTGITLTLNAESATATNLQIKNDTSATEAAVKEWVDKYNEMMAFIAENDQITREENGSEVTNIFGPLASTRLDDGVITAIRGDIVASAYDPGGSTEIEYRIFADLGITTERDGTLKFDSDKFQDAVNKEPDSVSEIFKAFGDSLATTGGTIDQYTRFNGLIDTSTKANKTRIDDLNDRIARAEEFILAEEQRIRTRFARLEKTISEMQSQQQALTSALAGLPGLGG